MASTEEDFPRGGIEKKPAETKTLEERREVDNLFQSHEQPETKKRKGASKEDATTAKKKKSASDPVTLNAPAKYVEILHLKNIKEGMLTLACVKEVADFDVVMSLPCGLQGFLQIRSISDGYTKLLGEQLRSGTEEISSLDRVLRPGMLLRCVVLKLDITKGGALSIKLSINPKLLNKALRPGTLRPGMTLSGCVESVEDHGYLVDIGVGETKAFLPRQVPTDQNPNPEELRAGQSITCRVDEVKGSGRVVRLSVNPLSLARAFADASHGWSLTSLQPGLLVRATVKTVTKHGLLLSFLSFSGQVDFLHMEPEEVSTYAVGQEVQACVLYIEPITRLVALSLRRHLLAPGTLVALAPAGGGGDRVGEVVDGCRVTSMHNMSGALLELPDQTRAFVHKNHLKEMAQTSAVDKLLSLPELSCRILNFSAMEQVHFASLRKSVRDKVHFRYEDIQVGEVVMGTVSELLGHGLMVQLSGNLKGLVPKTHLSDILLRNPEKKYIEGMKIKCRVSSSPLSPLSPGVLLIPSVPSVSRCPPHPLCPLCLQVSSSLSPLSPGVLLSVPFVSRCHPLCPLSLQVSSSLSPLSPGVLLSVPSVSRCPPLCPLCLQVLSSLSPLSPGVLIPSVSRCHPLCPLCLQVSSSLSPLSPGVIPSVPSVSRCPPLCPLCLQVSSSSSSPLSPLSPGVIPSVPFVSRCCPLCPLCLQVLSSSPLSPLLSSLSPGVVLILLIPSVPFVSRCPHPLCPLCLQVSSSLSPLSPGVLLIPLSPLSPGVLILPSVPSVSRCPPHPLCPLCLQVSSSSSLSPLSPGVLLIPSVPSVSRCPPHPLCPLCLQVSSSSPLSPLSPGVLILLIPSVPSVSRCPPHPLCPLCLQVSSSSSSSSSPLSPLSPGVLLIPSVPSVSRCPPHPLCPLCLQVSSPLSPLSPGVLIPSVPSVSRCPPHPLCPLCLQVSSSSSPLSPLSPGVLLIPSVPFVSRCPHPPLCPLCLQVSSSSPLSPLSPGVLLIPSVPSVSRCGPHPPLCLQVSSSSSLSPLSPLSPGVLILPSVPSVSRCPHPPLCPLCLQVSSSSPLSPLSPGVLILPSVPSVSRCPPHPLCPLCLQVSSSSPLSPLSPGVLLILSVPSVSRCPPHPLCPLCLQVSSSSPLSPLSSLSPGVLILCPLCPLCLQVSSSSPLSPLSPLSPGVLIPSVPSVPSVSRCPHPLCPLCLQVSSSPLSPLSPGVLIPSVPSVSRCPHPLCPLCLQVLSVEADKRRVTLTRKKALLTSTLPVVSSYAAARPGLVAHGCVVSIKSFGCIVRFYNEVKGLVPLRELSAEPLASPGELFYVGQVVKVKVLECEPQKERLLLSFKAVVEGDTAGDSTAEPRVLMEVGQRCEARLVTKSAECLEVVILPDEVPALLPTMHLSDHVSNCALLWEALEEGDVVSDLVCLSRSKESITLTQKPLVRWGLEEGLFVKGFSDLVVGMTLVGWIKKLMPYGVFVEFPCGIMGLAPKSSLCDRFVTDTASAFQLGQTVVAMVTTFDEEKQRFLVTLKGSEVTAPEGGAQALLLRGLRERRSAEEVLAGREGSGVRQELLALTVGQKLTLAVEEEAAPEEEGGGATFKSDALTGVAIAASKPHVLGVTLTPGQKVTAVVLQVDLLSARVHVSVLPKLLAKKKSLVAGALLAVMVQHVDQAFAVVAFESSARLAVVHAARHINDVFSEAGHLKPGSALSVTVTDPACAELRGLPLLRVEAAPSRHPAATTSESEASHRHAYGETLEGAVRSVKPTCVLVALDGGGTGSVHVSQVADAVAVGSFPTALLEVGARVRARVIGGREATSQRFLPFSHPNFKYSIPELTLAPSMLDDGVKLDPVRPREKLGSYKAGQQITCFVSKYNTERKCLEVTTDPSLTGTIDLLDFVKDPKEASHPEKLYKSGLAVRATVVEASSKPHRFSLSLN
ncbi:unnamed protein product, partial [Boreogadus saida]